MKNAFMTLLLVLNIAALSAQDRLPWLRTEGSRIVNEQGQTVILRGVNLGSWLAEEMWMLPFLTQQEKKPMYPKIEDRTALWSTLEKRFGASKMNEIRTQMRRAWMRDEDFARIRAAGLNCVRLPFLADLCDEPGGLFPWLDFAVEAASRHDLYVILDMHGTPGRQSGLQHTGKCGEDLLFKDATMVQKTAALWVKIAERYKNRPVVAGYDLINEPMGAPNNSTLYIVYDQIIRSVRGVDARHLIFVEDGYKNLESAPRFQAIGWQNVVMSPHLYERTAKSETELQQKLQQSVATFAQHQATLNAPIYLGEFNVHPHGTAATVITTIAGLQAQNISWSVWTYKVGKKVGQNSMWGMYRCPKKMKKIDPFGDSAKEIMKKIEQLKTENFEENRELIESFRATVK